MPKRADRCPGADEFRVVDHCCIADRFVQLGNPCRRYFFYRLGWSTRVKPTTLEILAGRDYAFRGDYCAGTDFGVVHNHCVFAENTVVADSARVNKAETPDCYVRADPGAKYAVGNVHGTRFSEPAV